MSRLFCLDRKTIPLIPALILVLPVLVYGQTKAIGVIDFYGLNKITGSQARAALTLKEGDSLNYPASSTQAVRDSEQALRRLPGVVNARVNVVCCDKNQLMLYVGIEEKGRPALKFRPAPTGPARLPDTVMALKAQFEKALFTSVSNGHTGEDDSQGYALSVDPAMRAVQDRFIEIAKQDYPMLRKVLRTSAAAGHRALSAMIMAYAPDKARTATDLVYAVDDPDPEVRNNAIRALGIMQAFADAHPDHGIVIPAGLFVDLLNSMVWTDRNKALFALSSMTEKRDKKLLAMLRDRALKSLVEMARWKIPGYAGGAIVILGRIGGMTDKALHDAYDEGELDRIIQSVISKKANN